MISIRRIHSTLLAVDRERVEQVQKIFRDNFAAVADYADKIPDLLDNPAAYPYRAILLVSEDARTRVTGFSLLLHFPEIHVALLDFIATRTDIRGSGLGGALYEATRDMARVIKAKVLYMESLPDDASLVKDPKLLQENRRRLKFYEQYNVAPIVGTAYETPLPGSKWAAPFLLADRLGSEAPLRAADVRKAIRTILEKKYAHLVSPEYVRMVVDSVRQDPVQLRPLRYVRGETNGHPTPSKLLKSFVMVWTEGHRIHHVRERGYVERPARVDALRSALMDTGLFDEMPPRHSGEDAVRAVHDGDFVTYLKAVCEKLHPTRPVYPYVFPIRHPDRRPKDIAVRAGYYCIDTFTPLDRNAYRAAREAVDVAMTAAEEVTRGRRVAYALCRPPGHHAERRSFGGFCYFNNGAIAANYLARQGRVALLDIDFHHGNGAQDIFWKRNDVLTISIHGHPNYAYPYFSGFADERGLQAGLGFNQNYPLPEGADERLYLVALDKALARIQKFRPIFLVVSLGLDILKGDPTGAFTLSGGSLEKIGARIATLNLPTLVVQEGGYSIRNLRTGSRAFFRGMAQALAAIPPSPAKAKPATAAPPAPPAQSPPAPAPSPATKQPPLQA